MVQRREIGPQPEKNGRPRNQIRYQRAKVVVGYTLHTPRLAQGQRIASVSRQFSCSQAAADSQRCSADMSDLRYPFQQMPPRKASSPPAQAELPVERLCDAVSDLTQHVRVLLDVLDEVREDLSWITRNGVPGGRPIEHTRLIRMARDPLAPDARDHLEFRTYTLEPHGPSPIAPEVFESLVSEIADAMTVVGQEQLNMLLTALDDARTKLMAAIKTNPAPQEPRHQTDESIALPTDTPPTQQPVSTIKRPGRLS